MKPERIRSVGFAYLNLFPSSDTTILKEIESNSDNLQYMYFVAERIETQNYFENAERLFEGMETITEYSKKNNLNMASMGYVLKYVPSDTILQNNDNKDIQKALPQSSTRQYYSEI
jgi:hypothetical protein